MEEQRIERSEIDTLTDIVGESMWLLEAAVYADAERKTGEAISFIAVAVARLLRIPGVAELDIVV